MAPWRPSPFFYQPEAGDKTILFSAYDFDARKWDAAENPNEPPPFRQPMFRSNGRVLSVAGPQHSIYDPGTQDALNVLKVSELLQVPTSFRAAERP